MLIYIYIYIYMKSGEMLSLYAAILLANSY